MKFKRIIAYFVLAIVLFATGCSTSKKEEDLVDLSCIAGQDLTNSSVVRWIGRTEYSATEERVYTYFAATGFVVKFVGTELYVTYYSDNTDSEVNRPYFVCMVDGQTAEQGTAFALTSPMKTIKVVSGLENGTHTATILKRSEPENAKTSISEIYTDGKFVRPPEHDGLKFQIIGSSGITGHGCLGTSGQDWTTENSSALQGFGYLTAQKFGGECQFVSASGMGMVWSYRGVSPMTEAYEATGLVASYNADGSTKNVKVRGQWNHSKWTPDFVVANIGGNDWNKEISRYAEGTQNRTSAENQFKDAVCSLLTRIHSLYADARIVWVVNNTSSGNGKLAKDAIETLSFSNKILLVPMADTSKTGADNHANLAAQRANAQAVADAITERWHISQKS